MAEQTKLTSISVDQIGDEVIHDLITEIAKIIADSEQEIMLSIDKTSKDKVYITLGSYIPKFHPEEEDNNDESREMDLG